MPDPPFGSFRGLAVYGRAKRGCSMCLKASQSLNYTHPEQIGAPMHGTVAAQAAPGSFRRVFGRGLFAPRFVCWGRVISALAKALLLLPWAMHKG